MPPPRRKCETCPELLPPDRLNAGRRRFCTRCYRAREYVRRREKIRTDPVRRAANELSVRKYIERVHGPIDASATRTGEPWTDRDDAACLDRKLSNCAIAKKLRRTVQAVAGRRCTLKRRHGLTDLLPGRPECKPSAAKLAAAARERAAIERWETAERGRRADVVRAFLAGETLRAICAKFGCARTSISKWVRDAGHPADRLRRVDANVDDMVRDYQSGDRLTVIAARYGCCAATVWRLLTGRVKLHGRGRPRKV